MVKHLLQIDRFEISEDKYIIKRVILIKIAEHAYIEIARYYNIWALEISSLADIVYKAPCIRGEESHCILLGHTKLSNKYSDYIVKETVQTVDDYFRQLEEFMDFRRVPNDQLIDV